MAPVRYRISVRGRLTDRLGSAFSGMTLESAPGQTALVGEIRDQSELYGVLDRVRSLGLELSAWSHPRWTEPAARGQALPALHEQTSSGKRLTP
jgi:hypothetical protein